MSVAGNVPVNGNLTVTSGTLGVSINGGFTLSVSGNAQFQGGTLVQVNSGIVDVAGNVTFSGTSVSAPRRRSAAAATGSRTPPSPRRAERSSSTARARRRSRTRSPGGTIAFPTLVISNGSRTMVNDFTIASSSMTIAPTGALAISGGRRLRVHRPAGATAFNVNGALSVAANGELSMGPQTTRDDRRVRLAQPGRRRRAAREDHRRGRRRLRAHDQRIARREGLPREGDGTGRHGRRPRRRRSPRRRTTSGTARSTSGRARPRDRSCSTCAARRRRRTSTPSRSSTRPARPASST